jgi:hypothetical protein
MHSIVSDDNESDDDSSDEDYGAHAEEEHETTDSDDEDNASGTDVTPPAECIESGLPSAPLKAHVRTTRRHEGEKPGNLKEAAVRALSFASQASAEALVKVLKSQQPSPQKRSKGQKDGAPRTAAGDDLAQRNNECGYDGGADSESEELIACSSDDDDDTINIDAAPQELSNATGKPLSSLDSDLLVKRRSQRVSHTPYRARALIACPSLIFTTTTLSNQNACCLGKCNNVIDLLGDGADPNSCTAEGDCKSQYGPQEI